MMMMRRNGFTKGLIVGSIIGASVSMLVNSDMMGGRGRKRMGRGGMNLLKRSGHIIGEVVDLLR